MSVVISMQDIRLRLADIAKRAEKGEDFTVARDGRPSFRIVPLRPQDRMTPKEARSVMQSVETAFREKPLNDEVTVEDIAEAIRLVRRRKETAED